MNRWYVLHTQSQAEEKAMIHLGRQRFEVYLPRYLKTVRHARRELVKPAPIFPRYLFINVDTNACRWRAILSTIGVDQMICDAAGPLPVPDRVISAVQQREAEDGYIILKPAAPFRRGDAVIVTRGPFKDGHALFECIDDQQRIVLLFEIMGRETRVRVSGRNVIAA